MASETHKDCKVELAVEKEEVADNLPCFSVSGFVGSFLASVLPGADVEGAAVVPAAVVGAGR